MRRRLATTLPAPREAEADDPPWDHVHELRLASWRDGDDVS